MKLSRTLLPALAVGAVLVTSCGSHDSGQARGSALSAQVSAWASSGGSDRLQALAGDAGSVGDAASAYDYPALLTACQALVSDVATAQEDAPPPDRQLQYSWNAFLSALGSAGSDCVVGVSVPDRSALLQSSLEMTEANTYAEPISVRLAELGVTL